MRCTALVSILALAVSASASGPVSAVATKTCPGAVENDGSNVDSEYCCIGGQVTVSVCAGWPICTGPTTVPPGRTPVCATTIPYSASNYDELVSSASSKYLNAEGSIISSASPGSSGTVASAASGMTITSAASATPSPASTPASSASAAASSSSSSAEAASSGTTAAGSANSGTATGAAPMYAATLLVPAAGGLMAYAALA